MSNRGLVGSPSFSVVRTFRTHLAWSIVFFGSLLPNISQAQTCANPVACENQLPGNTGWEIPDGAGDLTIQGFATDISVDVGGTISFKVDTNAKSYVLDIYRIGYYGGAGARLVATVDPSVSLPQTQPACITNSTTNEIDCGNWSVSASWTVPTTAVSGLYCVNLVRSDTGGTSQMFFVVRNDSSHSDILVSTSDETWQAYNEYGGYSLYGTAGVFNLFDRAFKVSYNRPYDTRAFEDWTFLFNAEYPMIRFLESNGYDLSYFTNVDEVRNSSLITNHKLLLSVGHDEYVSTQRRANIEAARNAGVNMAFFSGNEVFWKTRWENSIDGSNTSYRTLVCYKETYYGTGQGTYQADPLDPPTWTGTWRDPRFSPPADGGYPENALTGTIFMVNGPGGDNELLSITVPQADGQMRFWRNTSIAKLAAGKVATLPAGTLGYEWDGDIDNGYRPAGLFPLSTSTYPMTTDLLLDYGATYGEGNITHHLTLYRAPSGALVFGGGTVQWAWGLDSNHDEGDTPPDPDMQQATVNLFADMGVQPTTLQSGLVPASESTDHTPPSTVITSPAVGSTVSYGSQTTVSGTATDTGGGVVAAVEVSTDGGNTWHPATGRSQWSYVWSPPLSGSGTVLARAVDDSGNLQATPTSATYSVSGAPSCPCSIWNSSAAPTNPSQNDQSQIELGVKFRSDIPGSIIGIRFYKGSSNTGTHIGNLWTEQGTKLASVTFTNETATGWQQANFSTPVNISANTTYVASYYAPNGGYADDDPYFQAQGVNTPPLHALADGVDGGNGLYVYATGGGFPTYTFDSDNYWVDVVFSPSTLWSISGTVSGGAIGATVTLTGSSSATTTTNASGAYTFTNLTNGSYTVTPSDVGFTFSPTSQSVAVSGANVSGVNFTAAAVPTYSISGSIGVPGATVTLSGGASERVTADSSGNYTFAAVNNGTYTITPSQSAYTFNPANQAVTVNGSNVTGVNFTATALPTWSISGTITGASGVTVTLSGAATASTTTNAAGGYSFTGLLNGTYTLTPSVTGYAFTPSSQSETLSSASISGVNFTATQAASIWDNSATPGTPSFADSSPVELGLKFTSSVAGFVTGVRFYKGTNNTGTHIGHLWNSSGTNLATVTFTGETASGWQQANFATPISIAANTTYIISYYAPKGGYAADTGFFATAGVSNPPLNALSNTAGGGNGVYLYVSGGGFPADTYDSTNYWVDLVFAANSTWSISGTITGGSGATVALTGTSSATTTANSSGVYTFSNLANGSYTITPSETDLVFNPASQAVTVNNANVTAVNFSVAQYSISGSVGVSGATVTLSGSASATTTSGTSGTYTFNNLANGSYTVAPSLTGYTFSPANQAVTVNGANVTSVNFTATANTYSISGSVGISGATITLSGAASATTTSGTSGTYTFSNLANGTYTVTPSLTGYTFSPGNQPVTVNGANVTSVNFTATAGTSFSISGSVGVSGATVTLSGTASATTTSGTSGAYTFSNLANGSYTVKPSLTGYTFTPVSQAVSVNGANVTSVNFTATANTYSISGSAGVTGATLTLTGAATGTTTASTSGTYTFSNLVNGSYTIAPSLTGYTFSPANQVVTVNGANVTSVNFTATQGTASTYSISGSTGLAGATVTLSGAASATTTAGSTGSYAFSNLANGSYTVTPSLTTYTFTPANQSVTVSGANVTNVNFTGTGVISIDVTTSKNQSTASTTVATSKFSTKTANELLLAFVSSDSVSTPNTTVSGITTSGLTWVLVERTNVQSGTAEIWRAFASSILSSVTVSATLSQKVGSSMTVMSFTGVNTSGTNGSGAIGAVASTNAASGAPTASLKTTGNSSLVIGVGDDWDNATARTLGTGQTMVNQYLASTADTYWVQRQTNTTPTAGTTVTINDTAPKTDRYNLSICEILAAP